MSIKRIIVYVVAILVLIGCFVGYAILTKNQRYKKVVYEISYPSDTLFTSEDLRKYADKHCPAIADQSVDSVKLLDFERKLKNYPYLETVDVVTNQGTVTVKAKQEKVIAKVFTAENKLFYLAKSGKVLPDSSLSAGRVVVANGNIFIQYRPFLYANMEEKTDTLNRKQNYYSTLYTIWKIADYLDEDEFWQAQIGQIYIDAKGDVLLTPTVGEHLVIFGKIRHCDKPSEVVAQRFENLKSVYKQGFKITGWDRYKTINLKFGSGIPCERK